MEPPGAAILIRSVNHAEASGVKPLADFQLAFVLSLPHTCNSHTLCMICISQLLFRLILSYKILAKSGGTHSVSTR